MCVCVCGGGGYRNECFKLIKSDDKGIYNVTKNYISDKCCSSELAIHQGNLKQFYSAVFKRGGIIIIIRLLSNKSEY